MLLLLLNGLAYKSIQDHSGCLDDAVLLLFQHSMYALKQSLSGGG